MKHFFPALLLFSVFLSVAPALAESAPDGHPVKYYQDYLFRTPAGLRPPFDWASCFVPDDCVAVSGLCGQWMAVNKAKENDAVLWAMSRNAATRCPPPSPRDPVKVECRNSRCDYRFPEAPKEKK